MTGIPANVPVAVYGTLRAGFHNADLWTHLATSTGALEIRGWRLMQHHGMPFPFIMPSASEKDVVAVDLLLWNNAAAASEGLARLDRLEGAPELYTRVLVAVYSRLHGRQMRNPAWVYIPGPAFPLGRDATWIRSGDWADVDDPWADDMQDLTG